MTEKIIPDGYKLVAVKGLDELVYWLERCKDKGHLENCADLIEPFEAFEYRNVSEEAVIAAHEAKAVPSRADQLVRKYIECLITNDPDGASDATKSMVDYVFNCPPATTHEAKAAPAVPQGWKLVPIDPTREMLDAYLNLNGRFHSARADWAAMLAAAPTHAPAQACGNCFEGKSDMDHDCQKCGGTGFLPATPAAPSQEQWETSPKDGEQWETTPKPVTLTDEEIKRNWSGGACPPWAIKFARAIIAALREKE